jgi:hypothetical protein
MDYLQATDEGKRRVYSFSGENTNRLQCQFRLCGKPPTGSRDVLLTQQAHYPLEALNLVLRR